jgi:hypothetical protein
VRRGRWGGRGGVEGRSGPWGWEGVTPHGGGRGSPLMGVGGGHPSWGWEGVTPHGGGRGSRQKGEGVCCILPESATTAVTLLD